jgi:hypothetical protein
MQEKIIGTAVENVPYAAEAIDEDLNRAAPWVPVTFQLALSEYKRGKGLC